MASAQRTPRDIPFETDAEYQRLAEQHRQLQVALPEFRRPPGRNQAKEVEAPL